MMDDLISRQQAIDALHMHLMYRMGTDSNKKRLDEWINNLPSAQPEQRWIPCSERLPEDFQKVLVFWWEHSEPMIDTAFWQKDAKRFDGQHWVRIEDKITHWMPLPEPYQEGEQE